MPQGRTGTVSTTSSSPWVERAVLGAFLVAFELLSTFVSGSLRFSMTCILRNREQVGFGFLLRQGFPLGGNFE